jgi:predicted membrane protein
MDRDNMGEMHDRREERRQRHDERRKRHEMRRSREVRGMVGMYTSGHSSGHGHVWTGIFLLIIGVAALLKAMLFPVPPWVFTWQMLLIALGFFLGIRHNFHGAAWFILMIVGGVFLVNEFFPGVMLKQYLWPAALIILGIFFIIRPRRRYWKDQWKDYVNEKIESEMGRTEEKAVSGEDFIDSTSIFGGIKKNILSKNFKGGDITNIMGGSEIDLSQADISGTATIDLTQIFGGTKLIVPSNWLVKPQMAAIFGGVEDKRSVQNATLDPNKILILDGTSIFGGIEIRSY